MTEVNNAETSWLQLSNSNLFLKCIKLPAGYWQIKIHNTESGAEHTVEKNFTKEQAISISAFLNEMTEKGSFDKSKKPCLLPSPLDSLKQEGATDDDIKWWNNLNDEAKQKIKNMDGSVRLAFTTSCVNEQYLSFEDAFRKMMQNFTTYDDYPITKEILEETSKIGLEAVDLPLPYELHNRVDKYLAKIGIKSLFKGKESFQKEKDSFSTMNAFIRSKIRSGEL